MAHFSFVRPIVSILVAGSFAWLGGACATGGTPTAPSEADHEQVGSADEHLTAAQCLFFDVNGTDTICHATNSTKNPYTIVKTSDQGCINGHAGHAHDYIAVGDPTCQGGGCLPTGAPCDATLPCCSGSSCQSGTCVQDCVPTTCAAVGATCGTVSDGCGDTLDCGSCAAGSTCEDGTCQPSGPVCPCEALPGWLDFVVSGTECINYSGQLTAVYLYLKDTGSSRGIAVSSAVEESLGTPGNPALCGVVGPNNVGNAFITLDTQDLVNACAQSLSNVASAGGVPCP